MDRGTCATGRGFGCRGKRLLLHASWYILMSCTKSGRPQEQVDSNLSEAEIQIVDEMRAEVEIGRNMAGRLLGYYGRIEDDRLNVYLNQVANYVASYSDYPDRRYMVGILKHESVNAFACPGGYVLVTMGALRHARSEAELAAILGHEVAHVGKKHMFDTLRKMKQDEMEEAAKNQAHGNLKDPILTARKRLVPESSVIGAELARYLSGSAGAGFNILKAAQAGMTLMTEKGLDKELEYEADHEGVKYAIRAGYEPKAMVVFLSRLEEKNKKIKNLEKTHPPVEARKKAIAKLLKSLKAVEIIGASGSERFEKVRRIFPQPEKD